MSSYPTYRVVFSRQRVIYEHAVVTVRSSDASCAERDARTKITTVDWYEDHAPAPEVTVLSVTEVPLTKAEGG